jgi:hypothetical protein
MSADPQAGNDVSNSEDNGTAKAYVQASDFGVFADVVDPGKKSGP